MPHPASAHRRASDRQSTFIVRDRTGTPAGDWSAEHLELEDLAPTYLERAADPGRRAEIPARPPVS